MGVKIVGRVLERFSGYTELMEKSLGNDGAAYTYGILSELFFFIANLGVILIPNMDSGTALMVRGISSMLIAFIISRAQSVPLHLNSHLFQVVTIRNLFVGIHIVMIFYCIGKIPVSLIYVIEQTAPLWIFMINYFQYGLHIKIKDILVFISSMLGVLIITFPNYFTQLFESNNGVDEDGNDKQINNEEGTTQSKYWEGTARVILVFVYSLSMISFSFGLLYIKKAKQSLSVIQIIFNQGFIYLIFGSILSLNQKEQGESFQLTAECMINGLIIIGIFSYIYQIMYLRGSIITTNHGKYAMTGYSAVLFSYIYEIIILGEIPSIVQIIGLAIVIISLMNNS